MISCFSTSTKARERPQRSGKLFNTQGRGQSWGRGFSVSPFPLLIPLLSRPAFNKTVVLQHVYQGARAPPAKRQTLSPITGQGSSFHYLNSKINNNHFAVIVVFCLGIPPDNYLMMTFPVHQSFSHVISDHHTLSREITMPSHRRFAFDRQLDVSPAPMDNAFSAEQM